MTRLKADADTQRDRAERTNRLFLDGALPVDAFVEQHRAQRAAYARARSRHDRVKANRALLDRLVVVGTFPAL